MEKKGARRHKVLELLDEHGGLRPGVSAQVSAETNVPEADVYGVGTFYTLLRRPGVRRICKGLSCQLAGAAALLDADPEAEPVSCLGQCDRAPVAVSAQLELEHAGSPGAVMPDDPALLTNRGQAFMHIGDEAAFEKAKADFDRALEINPDLIAGYFNRGAYYMRVGEFEAAADDFTSVLDIDPAQPAAHFNRAMCYRELGKVDEAINDLVLVLAFRPDEELEAQAKAMLEELQAQQEDADSPSEEAPSDAAEATPDN